MNDILICHIWLIALHLILIFAVHWMEQTIHTVVHFSKTLLRIQIIFNTNDTIKNHINWSSATYLISDSLWLMGIGIGALGNSSLCTSEVNVTFGSQHLSLKNI